MQTSSPAQKPRQPELGATARDHSMQFHKIRHCWHHKIAMPSDKPQISLGEDGEVRSRPSNRDATFDGVGRGLADNGPDSIGRKS
jgi:hypothetical protein